MKTTTQVAAELGVKHWQIRHAIDGGYVDKPAVFAGRLMFDDKDVKTLKAYLRKEHNDTSLAKLFREPELQT